MRYDLFKKIKVDPEFNIDIYDIFSINWNDFEYNNPYIEHIVTQVEVEKTWMISYAEYGTVDYEDIIFILNEVENPKELTAGMKLIIPHINDIKGFILTNQ